MNVRLILVAFLLVVSCGFGHPVAESAQGKSPGSSPGAVIRSLYQAHDNGREGLFSRKTGRKDLAKYFDRKLTDLLLKNLTGTPEGSAGNLDFDPLYNTQDPQITGLKIGEPKIEQNKATVVVRFKNAGRNYTITYHLGKMGDGWKIQNLDYGGGGNLVKILSAPF